jgi:hypothetical protein
MKARDQSGAKDIHMYMEGEDQGPLRGQGHTYVYGGKRPGTNQGLRNRHMYMEDEGQGPVRG